MPTRAAAVEAFLRQVPVRVKYGRAGAGAFYMEQPPTAPGPTARSWFAWVAWSVTRWSGESWWWRQMA
eukprot:42606-Eustigmatos_ZCMA.PRE.1